MPISRSAKVRLGLTLGDPAGIGPEVLVKALSRWIKKNRSGALVFGPAPLFNALARRFRLSLRFKEIGSLEGWERIRGAVPCYFKGSVPRAFVRGRSSRPLTAASMSSLESAARAALSGRVDALVTSPINKAGLKAAGYAIPGHTEFLAKLSRAKKFEMMLTGGPLRVVLVTRHDPVRKVPRLLTKKRVEEAILNTAVELERSFGIRRPRLAVCGLNPHAGEKGTIGREELRVIAPAVASARRRTRARITGPLPPDVLFVEAYRGRYDAEVCMYHDQGLIPLKMISRGGGVNVTLGLPFVRTSPDHGTAYDIAAKGVADAGSMFEAIETAYRLALRRSRARSREHARR